MKFDLEKRARELVKQIERDIWDGPPYSWNAGVTESIICQLANEYADARAEEIAAKADAADTSYLYSPCWAAYIARSTISKSKTREQVLEEALREIEREDPDERCVAAHRIARRALEWKP